MYLKVVHVQSESSQRINFSLYRHAILSWLWSWTTRVEWNSLRHDVKRCRFSFKGKSKQFRTSSEPSFSYFAMHHFVCKREETLAVLSTHLLTRMASLLSELCRPVCSPPSLHYPSRIQNVCIVVYYLSLFSYTSKFVSNVPLPLPNTSPYSSISFSQLILIFLPPHLPFTFSPTSYFCNLSSQILPFPSAPSFSYSSLPIYPLPSLLHPTSTIFLLKFSSCNGEQDADRVNPLVHSLCGAHSSSKPDEPEHICWRNDSELIKNVLHILQRRHFGLCSMYINLLWFNPTIHQWTLREAD